MSLAEARCVAVLLCFVHVFEKSICHGLEVVFIAPTKGSLNPEGLVRVLFSVAGPSCQNASALVLVNGEFPDNRNIVSKKSTVSEDVVEQETIFRLTAGVYTFSVIFDTETDSEVRYESEESTHIVLYPTEQTELRASWPNGLSVDWATFAYKELPAGDPLKNPAVKGVLHIGAHFGEEAPLYAAVVGRDAIFIEAVPSYAQQCARVTKLYGMDCISAVIWHEDGVRRTFQLSSNTGFLSNHTTVFPDVSDSMTNNITLSTVTFQTLSAELPQLRDPAYNFLVIDVQGAEFEVLFGFGPLLLNFDFVKVEISDIEKYEGQKLEFEFIELLGQMGFQLEPTSPKREAHGELLFVRRRRSSAAAGGGTTHRGGGGEPMLRMLSPAAEGDVLWLFDDKCHAVRALPTIAGKLFNIDLSWTAGRLHISLRPQGDDGGGKDGDNSAQDGEAAGDISVGSSEEATAGGDGSGGGGWEFPFEPFAAGTTPGRMASTFFLDKEGLCVWNRRGTTVTFRMQFSAVEPGAYVASVTVESPDRGLTLRREIAFSVERAACGGGVGVGGGGGGGGAAEKPRIANASASRCFGRGTCLFKDVCISSMTGRGVDKIIFFTGPTGGALPRHKTLYLRGGDYNRDTRGPRIDISPAAPGEYEALMGLPPAAGDAGRRRRRQARVEDKLTILTWPYWTHNNQNGGHALCDEIFPAFHAMLELDVVTRDNRVLFVDSCSEPGGDCAFEDHWRLISDIPPEYSANYFSAGPVCFRRLLTGFDSLGTYVWGGLSDSAAGAIRLGLPDLSLPTAQAHEWLGFGFGAAAALDSNILHHGRGHVWRLFADFAAAGLAPHFPPPPPPQELQQAGVLAAETSTMAPDGAVGGDGSGGGSGLEAEKGRGEGMILLVQKRRPRRLYSPRGAATLPDSYGNIQILNMNDVEAEVKRQFPSHRVEVVDWSLLSIDEQVGIARRACVIVSGPGANILPAVFLPSGAHVVVLCSRMRMAHGCGDDTHVLFDKFGHLNLQPLEIFDHDMVYSPEILSADGPMAGLDPAKAGRVMRGELGPGDLSDAVLAEAHFWYVKTAAFYVDPARVVEAIQSSFRNAF